MTYIHGMHGPDQSVYTFSSQMDQAVALMYGHRSGQLQILTHFQSRVANTKLPGTSQ